MRLTTYNLLVLSWVLTMIVVGLSWLCFTKGVNQFEQGFVILSLWSIFVVDFFLLRDALLLNKKEKKE